MITSRKNPLLKDIHRSRRCKGDRALIEGPHLLEEALAAGHVPEVVLATPEVIASPSHQHLLARLPRPPLAIDPRLLAESLDADSPRGLAALLPLRRGGVESLPRTEGGIYLYLDGLQDPGNLGALARSAEAGGATGLALGPGTVNPNHPRALRASAGSLLRLPTARSVTAQALQDHLLPHSPRWLALAPRGGTDLYSIDPGGTLVLVLGAEGPGLSESAQNHAGERITIPTAPPVESLNATVALSVVLFELQRRRAR